MTSTDSHCSAATEPLVRAVGINKSYTANHKVTILTDLNLDLTTGEMIAIVGASGTGKSTLLHILGTLDYPTGGNLYFDGENTLLKSNKELSKLRNRSIGFVFQFHHLLPEFTALENVIIPGMIGNKPKKQLLDQANDLLNRIGLGHRGTHKVGELSGGEQQRIAIARALIMSPRLLLADEPTGNLDPKTGHSVFDLLRELNQQLQLTTVMVTHNHALAKKMDRCLTLADGKLH